MVVKVRIAYCRAEAPLQNISLILADCIFCLLYFLFSVCPNKWSEH